VKQWATQLEKSDIGVWNMPWEGTLTEPSRLPLQEIVQMVSRSPSVKYDGKSAISHCLSIKSSSINFGLLYRSSISYKTGNSLFLYLFSIIDHPHNTDSSLVQY